MSIFDNVIKEIDKGIEGRNTGISMKIGVLGDEICNLLPSTYYLLGGESGCVTGNTKIKIRKISEKNSHSVKDFRRK